MKAGLRVAIAIAGLTAAFVLPAQALAQANCANVGSDPTAAQYCSVSGAQTGSGSGPNKAETSPAAVSTPSTPSDTSGTEAVEASSSSSLPFTGLDVGILVLVAALLTGTGLALRRLTATGVPRS
jgi:cobalamin biosynthesis Mg chelatase CobN